MINMTVINIILRAYLICAVLGACLLGCLLPTAPVLMLCEKKQKLVQSARAELKWAIIFCVLGFATLGISFYLASYILQRPIVISTIQSALGWVSLNF